MKTMRKTANAFTIVELLIVIVVIAILAAISTVAYTGVSNRANDSVVESDLASLGKHLQMIHADTGSYPKGAYTVQSDGGSTSGHVSHTPQGLHFRVSGSSYRQVDPSVSGYANLIYCSGPNLESGADSFKVTAQSSSMANFSYSSFSGLEQINSTASPTSARACIGIGYPRSIAYGYFINSGGWQTWTQ